MATVTVRINGMEYNLKGKEDEAYLQHLASYVEDKLQEILHKNTKLSVSAASVLTAINLADESFKGKRELNELNDTHEILKRANKSVEQELNEIKSLSKKQFDEKELDYKNKLNAKDIDFKKKIEAKEIECKKHIDIKEIEYKKIIQDFKSKLDETLKQKQEAEYEMQSIKENYKVLEGEKIRLSSEIVELQEELRDTLFSNSSESLEDEIEELKAKIGLMESENRELKSQNKLLKQANKELKFNLQSCKYRVIDLENKFLESQIIIATEKAKNNDIAIKTIK